MPAKYEKNSKGAYCTSIPTDERYPNGRPKYKVLSASSVKELDKKVAEYNKNQMFDIAESNITMDRWYQEWFDTYKTATRESTQNFYRTIYDKHIAPYVGNIELRRIKEAQCQRIIADMTKKDYSDRSIKGVIKMLRSLFECAVSNKLIYYNPAKNVKFKGAGKKLTRRALTPEERKAYLNACKTHPFGDYAAFLYFFGLRRGEAVALTKADIGESTVSINKQFTYPDNNQPIAGPPKTSAGIREIFIPDIARKYIDFDSYANGYLFLGSEGKPMSYSEVTRRFNSFMKSAFPEGTEITTHYLRHNYVCMLLENGMSIPAVAKMAGHDNLETTMEVYTHMTEKMKDEAQEKIFNMTDGT